MDVSTLLEILAFLRFWPDDTPHADAVLLNNVSTLLEILVYETLQAWATSLYTDVFQPFLRF